MPAEIESIQRIAAAVTPAVMVSACGLVALGLDNQAGRMTTRMRDMLRERRALEPGSPRREPLARQIEVLARRHGMLARALLLTYSAMLAFVLTSLLSLAHGIVAVPPTAPLAVFAGGVGGLAVAAGLAVRSHQLSREAILIELGELRGPP